MEDKEDLDKRLGELKREELRLNKKKEIKRLEDKLKAENPSILRKIFNEIVKTIKGK